MQDKQSRIHRNFEKERDNFMNFFVFLAIFLVTTILLYFIYAYIIPEPKQRKIRCEPYLTSDDVIKSGLKAPSINELITLFENKRNQNFSTAATLIELNERLSEQEKRLQKIYIKVQFFEMTLAASAIIFGLIATGIELFNFDI